jgi:hypothetical protein
MAYEEYQGKTIGFAKVMGELPVSDGSLAYEIMNYTANEEGFLENKFKIMPLIPTEWSVDGTQPVELNTTLAMRYCLFDGQNPELLFFTKTGVFRYSPWNRMGGNSYGSPELYDVSSNGLSEQFYFTKDNEKKSVVPQSKSMYPPQVEVVNNRVYFSYCDGGGAYVWDGYKVRDFGYSEAPSEPYCIGPQPADAWNNGGGFCDGGRIGTLNYNLQAHDEDLGGLVNVGGLEHGLWYYAVVYENEDGAYSVTSKKGNRTTIQFHVLTPDGNFGKYGIQFLKRRFWLSDVPTGPDGTVARVLLRTMNLSSLPPGEVGNLRFLHRLPNNLATSYIDDIPDSELGSEWQFRRNVPIGFYFMKFFNGSMFLLRTNKYNSRIWWSEQDITTGSIPESFMHNHWRDVFPETGPITGAFAANFGNKNALLVFKNSAVHYVSGSYPRQGAEGFDLGTISTVAGCAGPNLCQSSPDGQIIWYGNGTFWSLSPEKGAVDIGQAIRGRLSKVNKKFDQFGVSWIDEKTKEMVFCLPYRNSTKPDLQFIWDYVNKGWRLRKDLKIDAVERVNDLVILAGSWYARSGPKLENRPDLAPDDFGNVPHLSISEEEQGLGTPTKTAWVYQRGYPTFNPGGELESTYTTGWMSFADFGPSFHGTQRTADSVFTMEERSARIATVRTYADWDLDVPVSDDLEVSLTHPEDNNIYVYGADVHIETDNAIKVEDKTAPRLFRKRRTYTHRLPVDIPSCTVFSLSISSSCLTDPMALISIDAYGPMTSMPGSRTPAMYEK